MEMRRLVGRRIQVASDSHWNLLGFLNSYSIDTKSVLKILESFSSKIESLVVFKRYKG
jgi:hypothetical protein